jgi:hypothetical protein
MYLIDTAKERKSTGGRHASRPVARLPAPFFCRIESTTRRADILSDHDRATAAIDRPEHAEDELRRRFGGERMGRQAGRLTISEGHAGVLANRLCGSRGGRLGCRRGGNCGKGKNRNDTHGEHSSMKAVS